MSPLGLISVFFAMVLTVMAVALYNYYFHLWWKTKQVQAPVPFGVLFGMTLHRISPRPVIDAYVAAVKGKIDVPIGDLVSHKGQGGNVRRVVENLLEARREGGSLNFEQACEHDLADGGVIEFRSPLGVERKGHE